MEFGSFSLVGIQLSQTDVSMGIIMESTSFHITFILIPLNSLFRALAMIRAVAPFFFHATPPIWLDRLPLLLFISPRYLYEGTFSSTSPLSFRVLFSCPVPYHSAFGSAELDMVFVCDMVCYIEYFL